ASKWPASSTRTTDPASQSGPIRDEPVVPEPGGVARGRGGRPPWNDGFGSLSRSGWDFAGSQTIGRSQGCGRTNNPKSNFNSVRRTLLQLGPASTGARPGSRRGPYWRRAVRARLPSTVAAICVRPPSLGPRTRSREARKPTSRAIDVGLGAGALGGIRTPNLLIRSQMLYPLSYERRVEPEHFSATGHPFRNRFRRRPHRRSRRRCVMVQGRRTVVLDVGGA